MKFILYICETCGKQVDEKFGSGRFCSRACANTRSHSEVSRQKISKSVHATHQLNYEKTLMKRQLKESDYYKNPNCCKVCGKVLSYNQRKCVTCSTACKNKWLSISRKHSITTTGKHVNGRHIVYKVVNDFDDRYYIGVRKTDTLEFDGYLGSGRHIRNMVNYYGKEHFIRLTLFEFSNSTDAYAKEKELIDKAKQDPLCVNIADGGTGGATFTGRHHSEETKRRLSELAKNHVHSDEVKRLISKKISESRLGKPSPTKGRIYINNGVSTIAVPQSLLYNYLENGYTLGRINKTFR